MHELVHTNVGFSLCSLRRNSPFLLLLILDCSLLQVTFVRKQLLEECALILSLWTLLLWPSDTRLTQSALSSAKAQLCSSGSLVHTL